MVKVGFTGQEGRELLVMYADHAIAAIRNTWDKARSHLGFLLQRDIAEALLLPMPRAVRKTARMIEKAYTDAPNSIESRRFQITSAPSAAIPDSDIAAYT